MHVPTEPQESGSTSPNLGHRRFAKFVLRRGILVCAIVFFILAVRRAVHELQRTEISIHWESIHWTYIILSVLAGMLALIPPWIAWHAILRDFGQNVLWSDSLVAYLMGHLGKYVPGKAMAVLLRVGELHRHKVPMGQGVLSVFIETLTGFATGGIMGALLLQWIDAPSWLKLSALACIPIAIVTLLPHPFRWILRPLVQTRVGRNVATVVHTIDARMMSRTVAWAAVGWMLQGFALWFVLQSLTDLHPGFLSGYSDLYVLAVCIASMGLGGLAGFLSMLPGGALARELASIGILISILSQPIALIATVVVRLTSIIAELMMIVLSRSIRARFNRGPIETGLG